MSTKLICFSSNICRHMFAIFHCPIFHRRCCHHLLSICRVRSINRGYYTAVRRYEFYLRVVKTIFYERAQRVKCCFHHEKIKFISSNRRVMFCLLYSCKQFKTQVNFRSIMLKTWLYFNII